MQAIDIQMFPLGILYPDGRVRLPDGAIVTPYQCQKVKPYEKPKPKEKAGPGERGNNK